MPRPANIRLRKCEEAVRKNKPWELDISKGLSPSGKREFRYFTTRTEADRERKKILTGDLALYIYASFDGVQETLMVASCLVPGIPEGCVAIKDFAENRGCLRELTNAGVVDDPHFFIAGIPICRLLF